MSLRHYQLFYPKLYAYGLKFTSDSEQSRDAIQELFTKLYARPEVITCAETLRVYLFTAFRNTCINIVVQANRHTDTYLLSDFELPFEVDADGIEAREEEDNVRRRIEYILEKLTPRQREIIYLRFLHQLGYEEIAQIMHLSGQAARNLMHRAIKHAQEQIRVAKG